MFDLALSFLVFGAAARAAFSRSFPGRESRVLAVNVGLALSVSLTLAQEKLEPSLARLGPVAVLVLCLLIFATSFKFLPRARLPLPLSLLLSALLALILVHATLPGLTRKVSEAYPLGIAAALLVALASALVGSETSAGIVRRRRPGPQLARQRIIPDNDDLGREIKVVKKRLRRPTRKNRKEEARIAKDTERIQRSLERDERGLNPHQSEIELMDDILRRTQSVRERSARLSQLDRVLQNFDLKWLKAAPRISMDELTPAQQMVLRKTIQDERKAPSSRGKAGRVGDECRKIRQGCRGYNPKSQRDTPGPQARRGFWMDQTDPRYVPFSNFAMACLSKVVRVIGSSYVFIRMETRKPWKDPRGPFKRGAKAAGLDWIRGFHDTTGDPVVEKRGGRAYRPRIAWSHGHLYNNALHPLSPGTCRRGSAQSGNR